MKNAIPFLLLSAALFSCNTPVGNNTAATTSNSTDARAVKSETPAVKPIETQYRLVSGDSVKSFKSYSANEQNILLAVNRTDEANIVKMDSILVPTQLSGDILQYSPFPGELAALKDVDKIIFFSYPAEYFAAYEHGRLVHSGPTNMGRKADPTPTGLFYTNWKAEETKSTFNDEWDLKWNFNIENKLGVGFHQYVLPGYPASHSCLRMRESDAKYMYEWADQWKLKGTDDVQAKGTPVVVFGSYPFGQAKPWFQLLQNPKALDIPASQLEGLVTPHLNEIKTEQQKRAQLTAKN